MVVLGPKFGEVAEWSKAAALGAALFGGARSNRVLVKSTIFDNTDAGCFFASNLESVTASAPKTKEPIVAAVPGGGPRPLWGRRRGGARGGGRDAGGWRRPRRPGDPGRLRRRTGR